MSTQTLTRQPRETPTAARLRAGDTVFYRPTKETWTLACDEDDRGRVMPCGFPASTVLAAQCDLITAAADQARLTMLTVWATMKSAPFHGDPRITRARQQLAAVSVVAPELVGTDSDDLGHHDMVPR